MSHQMMNHGNMGADHTTHVHTDHPPQPPPAAGNTKPPPPPTFDVHNQMMVGEQTIYLSHLPMFMFNPKRHGHNFQVILEVTLTEPSDAQAIYAGDRRQNPDVRMYTMSPEAFEMVEFDPQHQKRHSLTGTIFRGHLERGGEPIVEGAVAQVVNVVYFHGFERDAQPLAQLEYLLFGKAPELFLAHVITRPPDFDQILSVTVNGPSLAADDLRRGIRITVPGRANTSTARIKAGERVTGQAQLGEAHASQPIELELQAGTEWYFEEGELASQFTMEQTPEEKAAGF
jgi:hypothetical protein